jgi:hypothetical protein
LLANCHFRGPGQCGPLTHGQSDAQAFAQPLREFAERAEIFDSFRAFANEATQTHVTEEERECRDAFEQEYIEWNNKRTQLAQTGYDNDGNVAPE